MHKQPKRTFLTFGISSVSNQRSFLALSFVLMLCHVERALYHTHPKDGFVTSKSREGVAKVIQVAGKFHRLEMNKKLLCNNVFAVSVVRSAFMTAAISNRETNGVILSFVRDEKSAQRTTITF